MSILLNFASDLGTKSQSDNQKKEKIVYYRKSIELLLVIIGAQYFEIKNK